MCWAPDKMLELETGVEHSPDLLNLPESGKMCKTSPVLEAVKGSKQCVVVTIPQKKNDLLYQRRS